MESLNAYMIMNDIYVAPTMPAASKAQKNPKREKQGRQDAVREPVPISRYTDADFGDVAMVQSSFKTNRQWVDIGTLDSSRKGNKVWIRARCHTCRGKGNMAFLVLRKGVSSVQVLCAADKAKPETKALCKFAAKIPNESIVDVYGEVCEVADPVLSCTQSDVEILCDKIYVISASMPELPFQLEDASRPPTKEGDKNEDKMAQVGQNTRLDNRWLDLRTQANHAIFQVSSAVSTFFRHYFLGLGFVEIHTPKIIPGASEGGSDIFQLDYFGRQACLAQSPQLYKQMSVVSDLLNVFEIGPVFRAENSNTHRHMCEFTGLDFEMEIKEHYHEVLRVLGNLFVYIFDQLNRYCSKELSAINKQYEFNPLRYRPKDETLVLSFPEAISLLREAGEEIGDYDDFTTPQEKKLGQLVATKYQVDFYIVDKYPLNARPFYTMPCPNNPNYTNSYDVFIRGEEVTSGAQRIHDVPLLEKRAKENGIPLKSLEKYIQSFSMGAYPHGGAGIGLERVVMLFCGLDNIRKSSLYPRTPDRCTP